LKLIIVESPAKARTIERFLDDQYQVAASYGHIRDLPGSASEIPEQYRKQEWARLGVDPQNDFAPIYVVPQPSKKHVTQLRKLVKQADELLLATDEDREGEAISWHLLEVLKPKIPVKRIAFHEITRSAVQEALANPRDVDLQLVRAQESRRILDRLYGYSLSPVLWKKVRTKLSAGRVQSVAVRLVVEREEERQAFHQAQYFDIEAALTSEELLFTARLSRVGGVRLAGSKDFDPDTGQLREPAKRYLLQQDEADRLAEATRTILPWRVERVERKQTRQRPSPPFTTSTLQQAASRRLKLSPQRVMRIAQRLYEGVDLGEGSREGLITYMRTDSTALSTKALDETAELIRRDFGDPYSEGPRLYRTRSKTAQEAHEAIRPTKVFRHPDALSRFLERDELAVYRLIWKRTVASQMADARLDRTTVDFQVTCAQQECIFRANGSIVQFPGFLKVYGEVQKDTELPPLREGQAIGTDTGLAPADPKVAVESVAPLRHETQPPARYTEASLIRKLEEEGIGRPSTYAPVIGTIQERDYVVSKKGTLLPTYIGMAVVRLLRKHFSRYVDVEFTAQMEEDLDKIARGEVDAGDFLATFYNGGPAQQGLAKRIAAELPSIDYPTIPIGKDPTSGEPISVRIGRNYVYVQVDGQPDQRATLPVDLLIDEIDTERAAALIAANARGREPIGQHPETGQNIYSLTGPYGPYLQLGEQSDDSKPKRISLGRGTDPSRVDIDYALKLLSLPRELGLDTETGKPVTAGLGRYGPYVARDRVFVNVANADQLFTITLEEALELIRNKRSRPVLKEVGEHPESGATLRIYAGRYGPYVTDGKFNASLGDARDSESLTVADAVVLLAEAAVRKAAKRQHKSPTRKVAKKKTAKKTAKKAKKKTAKKATKKTAKNASIKPPKATD